MTSVTILAILVVMLAGVFSQVSRSWSSGEGNIERRRSARALTDYIGAELRSATLPAEMAPTPGKGNLQFLINPPDSLVPEEYKNPDTIFWTAPIATETSFGEIAEVGYFVRWVEPDMNAQRKGITNPRPALCRFFVNPSREIVTENPGGEPSRSVVRNIDDFLIYDANPDRWLSKPLLDKLAPANAPTYAGLFGENVVGLWVEAFGLGTGQDNKAPVTSGTADEPQRLSRTFYSLPKAASDPNVGYTYNRPYRNINGQEQRRLERRYLPARVRISIAQVDSNHIERLDRVWEAVRSMTRDESFLNADEFLAEFQSQAQTNPALAALLPGLRTYTTEVPLESAR